MSFNCVDGGSTLGEVKTSYTFTVRTEVMDDKEQRLMTTGSVEVENVEMEYGTKGDWEAIKEFTEAEEETYLTFKHLREGYFQVTLSDLEIESEKRKDFNCADLEDKTTWVGRDGEGGNQLFFAKMEVASNKSLVSLSTFGQKVKVSLVERSGCLVVENTATFDLNLVTN